MYTIPIWKLKLFINKRVYYYVCNKSSYVISTHINQELKKLGIKPQDYYDRWILGITVKSERPKCEIESCNDESTFLNIGKGYSGHCEDKEHHRIVVNRHMSRESTDEVKLKQSISIKKRYKDDPTLSVRIGNSISKAYDLHPEKRELQRMNGIKRYQDPKEVERSSNIMKELHRNGVFDGVPRGFGNKSKVFSKWENKDISLDSSYELEFFNKCSDNCNVNSLIRESIKIQYVSPTDNLSHTYFPDFLLNDHYLIEIKPNYKLDDEVNICKFNAADEYCRLNNLEYVIITEDYLFNNGSPFYGELKLL